MLQTALDTTINNTKTENTRLSEVCVSAERVQGDEHRAQRSARHQRRLAHLEHVCQGNRGQRLTTVCANREARGGCASGASAHVAGVGAPKTNFIIPNSVTFWTFSHFCSRTRWRPKKMQYRRDYHNKERARTCALSGTFFIHTAVLALPFTFA